MQHLNMTLEDTLLRGFLVDGVWKCLVLDVPTGKTQEIQATPTELASIVSLALDDEHDAEKHYAVLEEFITKHGWDEPENRQFRFIP